METYFEAYKGSLIWIFFAILVNSITGGSQVIKLLGDKVTLTCAIGNSTKADTDKITWQFNSKELMVDSVRLKQPSNSKLEISDLKYSDSGIYSCYVDSNFINSTLLSVEGMLQFAMLEKCFNLFLASWPDYSPLLNRKLV